MSVEMFADSRARLDWVERLCAQALGLANDFMLRSGARPFFSVDETVVDGVRFLRLGLPDPPADLGFLVADISTDGKSCLDMAMQNVVDSLGLDWCDPSFPLVYDPDTRSRKQSRAWQVAKEKLPAVIWEAIRGIQPHQPTSAYGLWDVPAHYTGWELQELTNANKHRNLTPVIFASSMLTVDDDDYLANPSESPWPTEDAVFV
ncbi:MAG: hypothetical protein REI45_03995, partial [Propionicimonas sp.]|nr:hypothetical protein [Propionicimonas sp.]